RQGGGNTTGSNQTDNPARHVGNFRQSQNQDVVVYSQFVTVPVSRGFEVLVRGWQRTIVVELDAAIAVFVLKLQQTGFFPVLEPLWTLFIGQRRLICSVRIDAFDQVQATHGSYNRSCGVEQRDAHQCPGSSTTGALEGR